MLMGFQLLAPYHVIDDIDGDGLPIMCTRAELTELCRAENAMHVEMCNARVRSRMEEEVKYLRDGLGGGGGEEVAEVVIELVC